MLNRSHQAGLSLVELMVGLVVGLIVVAGAGAMYVTTVRGQTYALRGAKLNQDLRATMNVIAADVRRAGYWGGAAVNGTLATVSNPFTSRTGTQTDVTVAAGNACVLYAYDENGLDPDDDAWDQADWDTAAKLVVPASEVFGFRLTGNVIQMLQPGGGVGAPAATDDCTVGTWLAMTDNGTVVIDALSISTTGSQCMNATQDLTWKLTAADSVLSPCAAPAADVTMNVAGKVHAAPVAGDVLTEVRQLTITLTGHHQSDTTMASTVVETVHLPNNRIFTVP